MGPLRLAVVLPSLGVFGGIRRFLELGEIWTRRGHAVALFLPAAPEARPWIPFTGPIHPLRELPRGSWDAVISPDPELLLSSHAPGALRVYYSVLERAPSEARAIRAADLVLANSSGMLRYLARRGVPAENAVGGVNVEWFRPPAPDPRTARRPGESRRVAVYGRLSRKRKGTWVAARAVERASLDSGVPVALSLFDSPPAGTEPPKLPRALRIPHRWVLDPSQRELADLYRSADLFVSAERRAGWCNTAAEAMACGTAVVCTRSGTEDFAVDQVTASVVRWPWWWAIARAVAALLRDSEQRATLAARGRSRIQNYSWEHTADRVERALLSRLGRRADAEEARQAFR